MNCASPAHEPSLERAGEPESRRAGENKEEGKAMEEEKKPPEAPPVVPQAAPAAPPAPEEPRAERISIDEFRKVELLSLVGCMDPKAVNYKTYFEKDDRATCRYR